MRWVIVIVGACTMEPPTPQPPTPSPDPVPVNRRCGEAGATPTPLPETVRTGTRAIGRATLGPGETRLVGKTSLHYDPNLWLGTMEVGHRGPALVTLIDRAEVDANTAWGGEASLNANGTYRYHVGPYRFDARASGEEPPKQVSVSIERRACPAYAVIENQPEPLAMWVSTEAIRLHTLQDKRGMLQVSLEAQAQQPPRLEVRFGLWSHSIEPRPGGVRTFRIDDRTVTIDAIERTTDSPAHAHARVRVEPATTRPPEPPPGAPAVCATPTPERSALPVVLAAARTPIASAEVAVGTKRTVAGVPLELHDDPLPQRPGSRRDPERMLAVIAGAPMTRSMIAMGYRPQLARSDNAIFRFETVAAQRVRVRALATACDARLVLPVPVQPVYVWLSSVGLADVVFGTADRPVLQLQLYADADSPSLGASSEHASDSQDLRPQLVGHVATMDALRIEIVDLVATNGTQRGQYNWSTPTGVPEIHVQVRITRD